MSNQITLFFILLLTFILFAGCTSQKSDDTILSIDSNAFLHILILWHLQQHTLRLLKNHCTKSIRHRKGGVPKY
jgi:hypothetical protein